MSQYSSSNLTGEILVASLIEISLLRQVSPKSLPRIQPRWKARLRFLLQHGSSLLMSMQTFHLKPQFGSMHSLLSSSIFW